MTELKIEMNNIAVNWHANKPVQPHLNYTTFIVNVNTRQNVLRFSPTENISITNIPNIYKIQSLLILI